MKKTSFYIALILLLFTTASKLQAQNGVRLNLGYNINIPAGSFADFMGKNSYTGFNVGVSVPVSTSLRLGLSVAHADYLEKLDRQIISSKEGDISAVVSNSIQTTPILFKADYTLVPSAAVRPYIGVGAGFNVIRFNQYLGQFDGADKSSFKPALSAGAGFDIAFNKSTGTSGIKIGANYNYMPFNSDIVDNLNNWGVHGGVYFPL